MKKQRRGRMYRQYSDRALEPEERAAFGFSDEESLIRGVLNLWLEVDLEDHEGWRVAFRLFPLHGQLAVSEIRILPADEWAGRRAGEWRADVLGFSGAVDHPPPQEGEGTSMPDIRPGVPSQTLRKVPLREVRRYAKEFRDLLRSQVSETTGDDGTLSYIFTNGPLGPAQEVAKMVIASRKWESGDPIRGLVPADRLRTTKHPSARTDAELSALVAAYQESVESGGRSPNEDVARKFGLTPSKVRDAMYKAVHRRGVKYAPQKPGEAGGGLTPYGERCFEEYQKRHKGLGTPPRRSKSKGKKKGEK